MRTVAWIVGAILILLGIVSLIFGDFTLLEQETVIRIAPLKLRTAEAAIPLSPITGGAALILGVVLMTVGLADAGLPVKARRD